MAASATVLSTYYTKVRPNRSRKICRKANEIQAEEASAFVRFAESAVCRTGTGACLRGWSRLPSDLTKERENGKM